ncbi:hypothetical protein GGS21DRAFT_501448 [Xylaria nigripes]|nr:hypothetical protein GGS21DRAFT_501448 [Xylaria nigripes]
MTEGVSSSEDAAAARAAEQARQRKLRREAKIKAGGASRLDKITGLSGALKEAAPQSAPNDETTSPNSATAFIHTASSNSDADPDEVDISQHYPQRTKARPAKNDASNLSEALFAIDRPSPVNSGTSLPLNGNHFPDNAPQMPGMEGMEGMDQDPMMQMLQKMMAGGMPGGMPNGAGGGAADGSPFAGTGLEGLFGAAGEPNPTQLAQQAEQNKTANLWRILHAIFALGLGLYVALATTFTGSKTEREANDLQSTGMLGAQNLEQARAWFFYVFTSVEAVLLTSRYVMEQGAGFTPSGWAWTITGFLPNPIKGYSRHALRYGQIFGTVRNDALFCVFVMGICCLLRS